VRPPPLPPPQLLPPLARPPPPQSMLPHPRAPKSTIGLTMLRVVRMTIPRRARSRRKSRKPAQRPLSRRALPNPKCSEATLARNRFLLPPPFSFAHAFVCGRKSTRDRERFYLVCVVSSLARFAFSFLFLLRSAPKCRTSFVLFFLFALSFSRVVSCYVNKLEQHSPSTTLTTRLNIFNHFQYSLWVSWTTVLEL